MPLLHSTDHRTNLKHGTPNLTLLPTALRSPIVWRLRQRNGRHVRPFQWWWQLIAVSTAKPFMCVCMKASPTMLSTYLPIQLKGRPELRSHPQIRVGLLHTIRMPNIWCAMLQMSLHCTSYVYEVIQRTLSEYGWKHTDWMGCRTDAIFLIILHIALWTIWHLSIDRAFVCDKWFEHI